MGAPAQSALETVCRRVRGVQAVYAGRVRGACGRGSVYNVGDQFWKLCAHVMKTKIITLTGRFPSADLNPLHVSELT